MSADLTPVLVAFFACIPPSLLAWAALRSSRGNAKMADEVKEKLEVVAKTNDKIHTLVNSAMTTALRTAAIALRRVADMTQKEGDVKAADMADKLLAEHEEKQRTVDAEAHLPAKA